jgi:hypothetical protein
VEWIELAHDRGWRRFFFQHGDEPSGYGIMELVTWLVCWLVNRMRWNTYET